jgi:hypothetical protein
VSHGGRYRPSGGEPAHTNSEHVVSFEVASPAASSAIAKEREQVASEPAQAEAELRDVAHASRTALAESMRLVRRYRRVLLRADLETAASLCPRQVSSPGSRYRHLSEATFNRCLQC